MAASKLWAMRVAASYLRISVPCRGFATVVKDLKYADSHEWVKVEGDSATIGITDHAQDHLGDVVYVELPEEGAEVTQGASFGAVESVKATSDINSPVSGKVVEVNTKLNDSPALVNSSPYEDGWIIKVEMNKADELNNLMDLTSTPSSVKKKILIDEARQFYLKSVSFCYVKRFELPVLVIILLCVVWNIRKKLNQIHGFLRLEMVLVKWIWR